MQVYKVPNQSRYEIKFVTYNIYYSEILNWVKLNKSIFKKEYDDRIVNNIYFDNLSYNCFTDNIYGSSNRTKIRLRWYGKSQGKTNASLELKFKRNIFGWKKRFKIKSFDISENITWAELKKSINLQVSYKGKIWLENYPIPTIINNYTRKYYVSADKNIRVTLDRNINVFDQRIKKIPNFSKKAFTQNMIVLEIKFDRKIRKKLNDFLNDMPIRVSRNSKYVNSIRAVNGF